MNLYIIVEGEQTEMKVYPEWLHLLTPQLERVDDAWGIKTDSNSYYLFSAGSIPSIFNHVSNAVADINEINASSDAKYDYLVVCIDVEEESREYIEKRINDQLKKDRRILNDNTQLMIFEHKICMETWFLGNSKIIKENPQDQQMLEYLRFYNVKNDDPELMDNIDSEKFATKAQFHFQYLRCVMKERNIRYSKNNPKEVCSYKYLKELINRFDKTGHISSFGRWYKFITNLKYN